MSSRFFLLLVLFSIVSVNHCLEEELKYMLRDLILSREEACTEDSTMPESAQNYLLSKINSMARSSKMGLTWDSELAKKAHDLSKMCTWVGKHSKGCNDENERGILSFYIGELSGDATTFIEEHHNIDVILKSWITASEKSFKKGREMDSDAMGHLYQTLSSDQTTSIGCDLAQPKQGCIGLRFLCLTNKYLKY